jgi:hypothetical protein
MCKIPLLTAALALCLVIGCVTAKKTPARPPSKDKIEVLSMQSQPMRPSSQYEWKVSMSVHNKCDEELRDVVYVFSIGKTEISRGKIPVLKPGELVDVTSDPIHRDQGNYQILGQVMLSKDQEEPNNIDRMNNQLALVVVVGY